VFRRAAPPKTSDYESTRYWRELHRQGDDVRVVGYPTLPLAFNRRLYNNQAAAVRRTLEHAGVRIDGASVLDVGSGTGFWLDLWQRLGASTVAAVELVPEAVGRLRERFPESDVAAADVSDGPPFPGRTFDVVSAMAVLLHVTDPERWRSALAALEEQLAPGGAIVLLEPVAVARHRLDRGESEHNTVRTLADWERALAVAGLQIVAVRPATILLSDPVDARTRAGLAARLLWWRMLARLLRGRERLASLLVPPLAMLDRALAATSPVGPSAKCVVIRRA